MCMNKSRRAHGHGLSVEVRGQLSRVNSLLPPCGLWESNSDHQVWQQVLLPTEPSLCPVIYGPDNNHSELE